MRKFLGSLVIVLLIVAGIGLYRGWFSLSKEDQPGETKVELRIDKDKVKADADEVARRASGLRGGEDEQGTEVGQPEEIPGPPPVGGIEAR